MEIYNENINDLLNIGNKESLEIRQNKNNTLYVAGVKEVPGNTYEEIVAILKQANQNRTIVIEHCNCRDLTM